MERFLRVVIICFLAFPPAALSAEKGLIVKNVRFFSYAAFTRIVFEVEAAAPYVLTKSADGRQVMLTAYDGPLVLTSPLPAVHGGSVSGMDLKENAGRNVVAITLVPGAGEVKDFVLRGPDRIVLDVPKGPVQNIPAPGERPAVVMLDPGHGGRDMGIATAGGPEKAIDLELALEVRKLLQKDEHLKVLLTRERDSELSLDDRAAAANAAGATIFIAIHTGEGRIGHVYIQDPDEDMNQTGQPVPARDFLSYEAGTEQQDAAWGRQQAAYAKESGALGRTLERLISGNGAAEPVQAPLAELKAVACPAVLVEVGAEQDRMKTAAAIAEGIRQDVRENR